MFSSSCVFISLIVVGQDKIASAKRRSIAESTILLSEDGLLVPGGQDPADAYGGPARVLLRTPSGSLVFPPAFVEEFGVAAVVVAAQEGPVTDLHEAVLLEDPLHAVVVGQGGAADGPEA